MGAPTAPRPALGAINRGDVNQHRLILATVSRPLIKWGLLTASLCLTAPPPARSVVTEPGVLAAPPTSDLVYKWNNSRIMWRRGKRSDSATLLIRVMALAPSHNTTGCRKEGEKKKKGLQTNARLAQQKWPLNILKSK